MVGLGVVGLEMRREGEEFEVFWEGRDWLALAPPD